MKFQRTSLSLSLLTRPLFTLARSGSRHSFLIFDSSQDHFYEKSVDILKHAVFNEKMKFQRISVYLSFLTSLDVLKHAFFKENMKFKRTSLPLSLLTTPLCTFALSGSRDIFMILDGSQDDFYEKRLEVFNYTVFKGNSG